MVINSLLAEAALKMVVVMKVKIDGVMYQHTRQ